MLGSNSMAFLTDNELNNVIYLFLKYGYSKVLPKLKNPSNGLIKEIALAVYDDPSKDRIIRQVVATVHDEFNYRMVDSDLKKLKEHMSFMYDEFLKLPDRFRNDVGENEEELVTKH